MSGEVKLSQIELLGDEDYERALCPVWEYLVIEHTPQPSDVIFVFGGLDLAVPTRAAELYLAGFAPHIIVSGKAGPLTRDVFTQPEAYVFMEEIIKLGVPKDYIIIEDKASNTQENVILGMQTLASRNVKVKKVILVAKPFLMRRCLATFQRHYPLVALTSCPPRGPILKFCDRPRCDFAKRLLDELERLKLYYEKGYITKQPLPKSVQKAASQLRSLLE